MVNPGPDEPSHGQEYPSLEKTPPPPDAYAPVDYPTDTGQPLPPYPGPYPGQYPAQFEAPPGFPQSGYPPPSYPPPGYPQPGMPPNPYQQAPAGYPYAYDPYGTPKPVGTNGKAIASLVTSLVGLSCCLVPGVVGLVLGLMAMREIKQTGQDGHGMALAGVIVGALSLALGVFALIIFGLDFAFNDSYGPTYSSY